jgi:hypothetical protein
MAQTAKLSFAIEAAQVRDSAAICDVEKVLQAHD